MTLMIYIKVLNQSNILFTKLKSHYTRFKVVRNGALQTLRKRLLCPAGVSYLEGKEDIFEDWREKFFNTWKVRKESSTTRRKVTFPSHTDCCELTARLTQIVSVLLLLRSGRSARAREQAG